VARIIAAPASHALFASVWGVGLPALVFERRVRPLLLSFAAAVAVHGLYDLALARTSLSSIAGAAVVLAVWIWFLRITPRLQRLGPRGSPGDDQSPAAS
jgi:RsiW-degrading membrane proteinase PrsW (M82 family)